MPNLEYEHRLTEVEDKTKANSFRITEIAERQANLEELIGTVKVLALRQEVVESNVKEIKGDVKAIEGRVKELAEKPGKRWDSIVDKALTTIIGAILLFMLAKLGF